MSNQTSVDLVDLIGAVAAREYDAARPSTRPALDAWIGKLRDLTDEELFEDTKYRIYESANCGRFRGNFEDVHCMATATYHEAKRRHHAAGHRKDCKGPTIYGRAHASVMREHGYKPSPSGTCTCATGGAQ